MFSIDDEPKPAYIRYRQVYHTVKVDGTLNHLHNSINSFSKRLQ